jgi:protein-S-isoprenylcysteine O-methyltransferase Ste14
MIFGLVGILAGLSLLKQSVRLALFTVCFVVIKTLWFMLSEEPDMRQRFGKDYINYCQQVPRWIPRLQIASADVVASKKK